MMDERQEISGWHRRHCAGLHHADKDASLFTSPPSALCKKCIHTICFLRVKYILLLCILHNFAISLFCLIATIPAFQAAPLPLHAHARRHLELCSKAIHIIQFSSPKHHHIHHVRPTKAHHQGDREADGRTVSFSDTFLTAFSILVLCALRHDITLTVRSVPGISAVPHEDNLRYFDVKIHGPSQSPYEGMRSPSFFSELQLTPPRRHLQPRAIPPRRLPHDTSKDPLFDQNLPPQHRQARPHLP